MAKPYTIEIDTSPLMQPDAFKALAERITQADYLGPVGIKQAMVIEHDPKRFIMRTDREPIDDAAKLAEWFTDAANRAETILSLRADRGEYQPWRFKPGLIWTKLDQFVSAPFQEKPQGRIRMFAVEERSWVYRDRTKTTKISFQWTSALMFEESADAMVLRSAVF